MEFTDLVVIPLTCMCGDKNHRHSILTTPRNKYVFNA